MAEAPGLKREGNQERERGNRIHLRLSKSQVYFLFWPVVDKRELEQ